MSLLNVLPVCFQAVTLSQVSLSAARSLCRAGEQPNHSNPPCPGITQAFKAAALEAVREYFASSDAAEVARRLEELNEPGLHNIMVKLVQAPLCDASHP